MGNIQNANLYIVISGDLGNFYNSKYANLEPTIFQRFYSTRFWLTPPSLFNLEEQCREGRGSLLLQLLLKKKDGPKSSQVKIGESPVLFCKAFVIGWVLRFQTRA